MAKKKAEQETLAEKLKALAQTDIRAVEQGYIGGAKHREA